MGCSTTRISRHRGESNVCTPPLLSYDGTSKETASEDLITYNAYNPKRKEDWRALKFSSFIELQGM